ncbi:hypothetical protein POX_a01351 [Penicillium oxalicum]|uniref:hypothetical protein n=1 Tax=Penicillium oxalicum TaxID=69781 RepID=UPI0020B7B801|nr:hypothetical protein POX_a01351 [Penicillium oxalicum]KAI2794750.1 hypothetical protein POX_a01351 [Penicillium oxalicum]
MTTDPPVTKASIPSAYRQSQEKRERFLLEERLEAAAETLTGMVGGHPTELLRPAGIAEKTGPLTGGAGDPQP